MPMRIRLAKAMRLCDRGAFLVFHVSVRCAAEPIVRIRRIGPRKKNLRALYGSQAAVHRMLDWVQKREPGGEP